MKLKKLVISGFKSFADKVSLDFSSGVTGIVGPNGCGKSNIVDAFRWVMGEQSAKAIRGDKMLDIIFAGGGQRKALNMAEVTLTFTEVAGHLPIDFEEVSVCRRVFRDGESEYLINKKPVRLKDIESLFWDSGLGKDAFCIFEQGKIDEVIQNNPFERRTIFEEAAGILRFKQRKKEALKRLEQAEQNCSRAEDIYQEVCRQEELLQKQSLQAVEYKAKKAEFDELEKELFLERWEKTTSKHVILQQQYLEAQEQNQLYQLKHAEVESQYSQSKQLWLEKESLLKAFVEKLFLLKGKKESSQVQMNAYRQQLQEHLKQATKCEQDIQLLEQKRLKNTEEFKTNQLLLQQQEQELQDLEKELSHNKTLFLQLQQQVEESRDKQKSLQQQRLELVQQESKLHQQSHNHQLRYDNAKATIKKLSEQEQTIEKQLLTLVQVEKDKRLSFDQLSQTIDQEKKELFKIDEELQLVVKELQIAQEALKTIQRDNAELQARYKILQRLKEEMEGLSLGTKRLLQETKLEKSPLYGKLKPLYELIKGPSGYEIALASALRPYAQTLVVSSFADLELVLQFSKEANLKEYSLLCLENISKDLVLEHFFKGITFTNEMSISANWVTKEGFYKDQHHVLFSPLSSEKNTFLREAELKRLTTTLSQSTKQLEAIQKQIISLDGRRQQLQSTRSEKDKAIRSLEMKHVEVNFSLQRALTDYEKGNFEKQKVIKERENLELSIEKLFSQLTEYKEQESLFKSQLRERLEAFQTAEKDLQQFLDKMKAHQMLLTQVELSHKKKKEEIVQLSQKCQWFQATDLEQEIQFKRLSEDLQRHFEKKEELTLKEIEMQSEINALQHILSAHEQSRHVQENELKAIYEQMNAIEENLKHLQQQSRQSQELMHKKEIQCAEEKAALQMLQETLESQWQLAIEELKAAVLPTKGGVDKKEKRLRELRLELEQNSGINLAAVEEYQTVSERKNFLRLQLDDLLQSKQELIQIVTKLDEESRHLFEKAFFQIRQNFQKNFQILFEGGEADLILTESKDLLEAGIEISAKPPGKQMRSISLLSGGEKCLTAMALLFAIFEVKPSAFCILDEVDAPLDEANVRRFTKIIQQFAEKTQFIIVTHNKCTMASADLLFGVSMEEKGVSKLLSLSFNRNEHMVLS